MVKETLRKCIVSGKVLEKDQLLRFSVTPDKIVVPDFKKRLLGKGVYVLNSKETLCEAINKGIFSKALKTQVKADKELVDQVEHLLVKQALDAISLARKSGTLVCGLDKVLEAIKKGKAAFVLEAIDAGEDGYKKIEAATKNLEIFRLFRSEELDKELAKDSTVHLAFYKGNMANMVKEAFRRLASFLEN